MGPIWGLLGRPNRVSQDGAREASAPKRGGCEYGVYCNTNEPTQRVSREGRLGVPSQPSLASQARQPRGSFPPFSSSFFCMNFPKPALPVSRRNPACERTFYYFRRKHLQSASESSVSLVNPPAACPSSLQT